MVNFGLSHGIAGPLAVLSISKLQGVSHPGLEEAIERLIEFFLQYAQEQPDGEVYWAIFHNWRRIFAIAFYGFSTQKIELVLWSAKYLTNHLSGIKSY